MQLFNQNPNWMIYAEYIRWIWRYFTVFDGFCNQSRLSTGTCWIKIQFSWMIFIQMNEWLSAGKFPTFQKSNQVSWLWVDFFTEITKLKIRIFEWVIWKFGIALIVRLFRGLSQRITKAAFGIGSELLY